ncbi:MAG: DNA mismatch repair protein MutS [Desulfobacterales bacterium]|nr:DNA mismatch repair protein MutS [Desulfobacterales bacterium]
MSASKITPMVQQYLSIKGNYPDAILFYRMGDFYEMFFDDAKVASKLLEITLTSRNKKEDDPVPMCGVPARAVQGYVARLIEQGFKVAVCDQTEDPALAKGLVKREVVRVITPGMIIENEFLDEKSNNYLLSVASGGAGIGLSCLDISTGAFRIAETGDIRAALDEAVRISPSEVLFAEGSRNDPFLAPIRDVLSNKAITYLDDSAFDYKSGRERLIEQFKTLSLEGFGCENLKAGVGAAGALLHYIQETQKQKISHLNRIETYHLDDYLLVDDISFQNLEIIKNIRTGTRKGSLLEILDKTMTAMGARLLKNWLRYPLIHLQPIRRRLEAVDEARKNVLIRRNIRDQLKSVYDLERLSSKISMGHANARDLLALKQSIQMLPNILSGLSLLDAEHYKWNENIEDLYEISDVIEKAIREDAPPLISEGGIIKTGYNPELDDLIRAGREGKGWLAQLEVKEKSATGINSLKVRYNKVFGYYIEVSKGQTASVPSHYIRKQTLVNAERYITDELKTFESKVLGADERRAALEYELFNEIRSHVVKNNTGIQQVARFIAGVDCLLTLAEVADQNDYCKPELNERDDLVLEDGRHPMVEKVITGERFVPNTIGMDNDSNQILIITGPNMAGKSTILRQVAICVLMAQMGSFVPAKKASISITDRIFTRVGALDNLSQGQSTFMVEMEETANILHNATSRSLVIMDEIGRGTSTFDGLSIAWAVAEYLHDLKGQGVKTLFATHYHKLTDLARTRPRVKNYHIAVREWNDEIIFLRKLVDGSTNRSYGIQVARLAGIPETVVRRAKEILFDIENEENSLNGTLPFEKEGGALKPKPRQLDLFHPPEHHVVEKLKTLDISNMTPLDALILLNEMKKQV